MGVYCSAAGIVRVECISADTSALLECMLRENIVISDIASPDAITLHFSVSRRDYRKLTGMIKKRGDQIRILRKSGIFWYFASLRRRPILMAGILALSIATLAIPTRVLFIRVEGNETVPDRLILEAAEKSGLCFGSSRRELRSEQIKNRILDEIDALKWAGVNTYGCQAVITVREREIQPGADENRTVRHICASRDGIITSCTVTGGNGLCSVGQAVKQGDILISGYTDCGITIRAERAKGTVMAATNRNLTAITPSRRLVRTENEDTKTKFSLIIGKKRINFYKGSGISGGTCVKMSTEYVLTLPGGFQLPVSLKKETVTQWEAAEESVTDADSLLRSFSERYLNEQMNEGTVIGKSESVTEEKAHFKLHGSYACIENIGVQIDDKIGEYDGKTDRTDRERRPGG